MVHRRIRRRGGFRGRRRRPVARRRIGRRRGVGRRIGRRRIGRRGHVGRLRLGRIQGMTCSNLRVAMHGGSRQQRGKVLSVFRAKRCKKVGGRGRR
jgi:hypothetical protein